MRRARLATFTAAALAAVSLSAHAQNAFTSRAANLRAGPDRSYPLVARIGPGAPVQIMGCLSDWSWCDIVFQDARGWIYAPSLSYVYDGSRVPLYSYAPSFGLPIVTFSLGAYWDRYYRGRPWYAQRNTWASRRIPHMRPHGPPPHAGPPPRGGPGRGPLPGGPPAHGRGGNPGAAPGERPGSGPGQRPGRPAQGHGPRQESGRGAGPQGNRGNDRGDERGNDRGGGPPRDQDR